MWIDDRYAFVDWRHGAVWALRSTMGAAARGEDTLPAPAARQIVMALGRDPAARHHLVELCEGVGIDVNRAAGARARTADLTARLLRAVERGQLMFSSGRTDGGAPRISAALTEMLEVVMPARERRTIDGQQYRLAPLLARARLFEEEVVVPRKAARGVLGRMRERFARTPAENEVWERAIEQVRDGTERDETPSDDALVLLRLVVRAPAPPPAPPAVTPSSLVPEEPAVVPLDSDEAPEFSCADEQAEAMAAAARDGVPFCLECACGHKDEPAPDPGPESEADAA